MKTIMPPIEVKRDEKPQKQYIASCGNDCTKCPLFRQNCLEGCLGEICVDYCSSCAVRNCSLEHKISNCAECASFPCQKLAELYAKMKIDGYGHWAKAAEKELLRFRNQVTRKSRE
jgi:hypothetical protein